jgi:ketosteroid isomerase-like protein
MKSIISKKSVILIAALFTAILTHAQQTASEYQTQIEELNRDMVNHMLSGNFEGTLDMYTPDAISLPSNEPMLEGISDIRKSVESMSKSGVKIVSFEPTIKRIIPEGNLIMEIGSYKIRLTVPGMDEPVEDKGKYLTVWEKQPDGSLKIKVETWNSDENSMGMGQEPVEEI